MRWKTSRREIEFGDRPLVMAILNVTPDSFSDGSRFLSVDLALAQAERLIEDGADILDIGGESTRPGGTQVPVDEEITRVMPMIEAVAKRHDLPISIDTTKYAVAARAVDAGAEIINDISGLRWEPELAELARSTGAGIVLMHSSGSFETMHSQDPAADIVSEVAAGLRHSIDIAMSRGVRDDQIVIDVGIGFSKTFEQNLELIANLDKIVNELSRYPMLVGASRKSFIGKIDNDVPATERLGGSLAAAIAAVRNGASVLRVHDVSATAQALLMTKALSDRKTRVEDHLYEIDEGHGPVRPAADG